MDEIIRTEVPNNAILNTLVPEDNIPIISEMIDSTSKTKFHRVS
jgi:hypothetical protein